MIPTVSSLHRSLKTAASGIRTAIALVKLLRALNAGVVGTVRLLKAPDPVQVFVAVLFVIV